VVAIAESNPTLAKAAAERYRIPRSYSDYRELLDQPDIDAVTVSLPTCHHAVVGIEALKARKHVLVENPLALNGKEAGKLADTAKATRRTLMVAQELRFSRHTQLARLAIERGDLGEIYHARCVWLRRNGVPRPGSWSTQKQLAGGGCASDLGARLLDACLHLIKEFDVVSVFSQTHSKIGPRAVTEVNATPTPNAVSKVFDVEDFGAALLRLKSGRSVSLEVCWIGFVPEDSREYGIDLLGTMAGLSLYPARLLRNGPTGYETIQLAAPKLPTTEDRFQHFISCVLDGKKPLVPLEESLKVQQILDAIYASAATGKEVRLK
jgi:predicted dehydrogenase